MWEEDEIHSDAQTRGGRNVSFHCTLTCAAHFCHVKIETGLCRLHYHKNDFTVKCMLYYNADHPLKETHFPFPTSFLRSGQICGEHTKFSEDCCLICLMMAPRTTLPPCLTHTNRLICWETVGTQFWLWLCCVCHPSFVFSILEIFFVLCWARVCPICPCSWTFIDREINKR